MSVKQEVLATVILLAEYGPFNSNPLHLKIFKSSIYTVASKPPNYHCIRKAKNGNFPQKKFSKLSANLEANLHYYNRPFHAPLGWQITCYTRWNRCEPVYVMKVSFTKTGVTWGGQRMAKVKEFKFSIGEHEKTQNKNYFLLVSSVKQ